MADWVGQQFGNYRLIRILGEGAFAEVYLGEHIYLSTQAAIKVLHTRLTVGEMEGFRNEARTIANLVHPNIVRVLEFGVERSIPYLVMDYASNGSLRQRHSKGIPLPLPIVVFYIKQIAAGLQYAHNQKLIHRDIKPENMLLGRNNEVLLSDFGVALIAHSSRSQSMQEVAGTVTYMAPEQIQGKPRLASDQYALGVVVYEWLCGSPPFRGSFTEIAVQHALTPPSPLHEKIPTISPYVEQVVMTALEKDPHQRFAGVQSFAMAFEQASQMAEPFMAASLWSQPPPPLPQAPSPIPPRMGAPPSPSYPPPGPVSPPQQSPVYPNFVTEQPSTYPVLVTEQSQPSWQVSSANVGPSNQLASQSVSPLPTTGRRSLSRISASVISGILLIVVVASSGLLYYYLAVIRTSRGTTTTTTTANAVHGGTWIDDLFQEPDSLIPNASSETFSDMVDQAIWSSLFVGDSNGNIQPNLVTVIPTVANGGISADLQTWTFHLRPGLKWSDGQPLDARDVDFSWRLWTNPKFPAASTIGFNLITSTDISSDNLTITFHLKQAFSPFLSIWTDGLNAPLPAHHFMAVAPDKIVTSLDNLNPSVTSGPFMMKESKPGDHYTVVRNPNYYRASEGLPYLDSVVFRVVTSQDTILKDLQAGTIDSAWFLDVTKLMTYQRLTNYQLTSNPNASNFEAMYFNFHNKILGSHQEVRQAMAMAVDHQTLIDTARHGQAVPLCTDHGKAYHPGFEPDAPCPKFDPAAANALLDQNGWIKGADGVRTKAGMRLEFEYSTTANNLWRADDELTLQSDFKAIGVKIDIQNYPASTFFGSFLGGGQASPPTGAQPGKDDMFEFENSWTYDADDSSLFACNQFPPNGANFAFYCNPQLDKLFMQEQATADPTARQMVFNQIHQIYLTDFPLIVLYGPTDLAIHKNSLHNYNPGPFGASETINIWEWWCDGGQC